MDFSAIRTQVIELLQHEGRVAYRALKLQFQLDDDHLEALKDDLIYAKRLAVDEDGRVLVWTGGADVPGPATAPASQSAPPQAESAPAAPHTPDAERRQLTVLFCDLVDSTALASQFDPEDLREVIRAYQAACAEVIQRFDGHIAQYLGDGLLVYFGYPQAHEDDAQRAVRTGLDIIAAMGRLNASLERQHRVRLAVRLGIHTGLVVVGTMGDGARQEQLALGDTPNIAARLQGLAAPDTALISEGTARLVEGFFTWHALGAQDLKGLTQPLRVYRVLHARGTQTRLDVAATRGLTPLVGRDAEVTLLRERWTQVKEGRGHVIVLSGEAGIGKSRLVQVLKEHVAEAPHTRWECRCSPYYQHTALYPLIDFFQRALHWQGDDTAEAKLETLAHALRQYALPLHETVPLMAALLSLPLPADLYPSLTLSPQRQRQQTLDTLVGILLELSAQHPVLVIVEDLHWVDPTTVEWLRLVMDQAPTTALCLLLTCRPEFQPPWGFRAHVTPLALARLPQTQAEVMLARLAGDKTLPAEVRQQVVARTDGVPLFVEELTKMVLESGLLQEREERYELAGPLPPLAIPATLYDSLMARLDRLAAAKEVAQLGAVLGREFAYELLRAVTPLDEATLQQALAKLVDAELLYQRGVPPQTTYLFKHALIQDTAYQSLLKSTRQQAHQRIAQVLETRFAETVEAQPELLAHHYTEAGLSAQALPYWQRAGERALQRSAHVEAISHLTKGLELLQTFSETPERVQRAVDMHIALGASLIATKGFAAPEVGQTYTYARQLCQSLEDPGQLFPVLRGLWSYYGVRAELQTAHALGEQLLALAQQVQDAGMLMVAHRAMGQTLAFMGQPASALTHLTQGIALSDRQQHRASAFLHGEDSGVICRIHAARVLWCLGYPDQGLTQIDDSLTLAQQMAHPFSLSFALSFAAMLHQFRREGPATQAQAEAAMALATTQGFPHWLAHGTVLRGWALAEQSQEGAAQIRQGMAALRAVGNELSRPYFLALLAEACEKDGQAEEGLSVLAEALAAVHQTGVRFHEAELYRLQGELLLAQSTRQTAEAETCFHQALDVARHQQAKSWKLRAAMSLARLWQQQGKQVEARQLLAPIYGWFTEGFDTADLQEARALLEALGENP